VKLKICLVGDEGVGKTSLVRRYVLSEFDERYFRTVGVLVTKRIAYVEVDGGTYGTTLTVWDILGRRDFVGRFDGPYLANAAGVLAVCDLTRPETLDALGAWLDRVRAVVGDVPAIVLANKRDLQEHVRIQEDDLLAVCETYGIPCLETSAKTGENVETAFGKLAEMALRAALAAHRTVLPDAGPVRPSAGVPEARIRA
jgi:small GTP-binding protein